MEKYLSTPIVKPVDGACNLSCSYCYTRQRDIKREPKVMADNILSNLITFFCSHHDWVEFVWHGGEPLLAGIDFYEKVINSQSTWLQKGKEICNSIQTNATMISKDWIHFFEKNHFLVGVSFDGLQTLHDRVRIYPRGEGSYKDVMRGIRLLQEAKLFTGVICCVSSANFRHPEETLEFFINNGIKQIKFNRIRGQDSEGNPLPSSISNEQYADFLLAIFNKWLELDDPDVEIREIDSIINLMLGGDLRECVFAGECYKYATVYCNGDIYTCDCFNKEEKLKFGTVLNNPFEVKNSENFQKFITITNGIRQQCLSCQWHNLCRGGCLQDWIPNIFSKNPKNIACESLKRIFCNIQEKLNKYKLI